MKQDTKDWIKKTAGVSTAVATPGIIAATLAAGLPVGLFVGGAVAAGNVMGSAAYKTFKNIKEDVDNRRKYRDLQRHVLAQNGILHYQPMVPVPNLDMSCSKDMSCLNKILKKDFTINEQAGNFIYNTPVGQVIDKGINLLDNYGGGVIVRNGHTVRGDFKKVTGFSEENLLSVDEEELKHMRDDIEFTNDPSERELKKSRYLSMLNESSRECLLDMLKEKHECCEPCEPVRMFSESPNLQSIARGGDFGAWRFLGKVLGKVAEGAEKLSVKIGSKAPGGGLELVENVAEKTGETVSENATKVAEEGAKVAANAGKQAIDISEGTTNYVKPQYSFLNKFTKKGRTTNIEAGIEDGGVLDIIANKTKLGRHAVADAVRVTQDAANTYMKYQIRKNEAKNQNKQAG